MTKAIRILIRIIVLPFFSGIALVAAVKQWVQFSVYFVMYGGEAVLYHKKHSPKTIADIINMLEERLPKEQSNQ